jgi:uncharacterized protein (TIGR02145 family)
MNRIPFLVWIFLLMAPKLTAQVAINTDGGPPDSSAILDLRSTEKGLLIPRMTFVQRNAIENPVEGLMVICRDCTKEGNPTLSVYQHGFWMNYEMDTCLIPGLPPAGENQSLPWQITWKWHRIPIADGYYWLSDGDTIIDLGADTSFTETGLSCQTPHMRCVRAYNDCGLSGYSWFFDTTASTTFTSPAAGTHLSGYYQISWNWTAVEGALGYKWHTVPDSSSASDLGISLTFTEYGLNCGDSYTRYVWAYDSCGISEPLSMVMTTDTCPSNCQPFTDIRDSIFYHTVLIGDQCWMKENLNYGIWISSTKLSTDNDTIEKHCLFNIEGNCAIYGGLYEWDEIMQYQTGESIQGICPDGWHLPAESDWNTLATILGGDNISGGKMKESGYSHWYSPNTGATNESAFSALPGGIFYTWGAFESAYWRGLFQTSTEYDQYHSYYRLMSHDASWMLSSPGSKSSGLSVRCIKN